MERMRLAVMLSRVGFAAVFVFFGLNGFLKFLPADFAAPGPAEAEAVIRFLLDSFLIDLLCIAHIVPGAMLLLNRRVPLGLALFFPQIVTILAFHLLLDPAFERAGIAYLVGALYIFLLYAYRPHFAGLLYAKADPEV